MRADLPREIRAHVTDPVRACAALGLTKDSKRQIGGIVIRCPVHREKTPSCSVTRGPDGTIRVRCFGCDFSGDLLSLVAVVRGLDVRRDFREVLIDTCRTFGLWHLSAELETGRTDTERRPAPALPPPPPLRDYPPASEVRALWRDSVPPADHTEASGYLVGRMLDPELVPARALVEGQRLPRWARYSGQSWIETGHKLIVPVVDAAGIWRSVRAIRITDSDTPKRLPPAGHRAAGLVLANRSAIVMLRGNARPERLIVVEGEPDFFTWTTRTDHAVVGVLSGAWTSEHAKRVPVGTVVVLRTHADAAGEHYAAEMAATLDHCRLWRAA